MTVSVLAIFRWSNEASDYDCSAFSTRNMAIIYIFFIFQGDRAEMRNIHMENMKYNYCF